MKVSFPIALFLAFVSLFTGFTSCGSDDGGLDSLLIKESVVEYRFSNNETKDKFVLQLTGQKAAEADLKFFIVTASGDTIYRELLKGKDLLPEDVAEGGPEKDVRETIVKGMELFFDNAKFQTPAAAGGDFPEKNDIDIDTYRGIQADPAAVSFFYKTRGPVQNKIAYDKAKKETVLFYSCCRNQ